MATPQKQTLTVTGRSFGEKYTRSARYIKRKHFWQKANKKTKQTYEHRQGMLIHAGKKNIKVWTNVLAGKFRAVVEVQ